MATISIEVRNNNGALIGQQPVGSSNAARMMAALANQMPAARVFGVPGLGIVTAVMERYNTGCIGLRHLHDGEFRTHSLTEMQREIDDIEADAALATATSARD